MCNRRFAARHARRFMDFPPGFLELNAPRQRPPLLGNPIFGYSTHPMPPPVTIDELPTRTTDRGRVSKASAANMAKLNELQSMLHEERKLRKQVRCRSARCAPPRSHTHMPPLLLTRDISCVCASVRLQLEAEIDAVRGQ